MFRAGLVARVTATVPRRAMSVLFPEISSTGKGLFAAQIAKGEDPISDIIPFLPTDMNKPQQDKVLEPGLHVLVVPVDLVTEVCQYRYSPVQYELTRSKFAKNLAKTSLNFE